MSRSLPQQPAIRRALAAEQVANQARKAEKAAERKAAREATQTAEAVAKAQHEQERQAGELARAEQDRLNRLATAQADAEALGKTPEEVLADMGCDAQGALLPEVAAEATPKATPKATYTGPMVALKAARANYVKPANGILCNGDGLAMALGEFKAPEVVRILLKALKLTTNPYLHLNMGQQSMNLRNKARHVLTLAQVKAAIEAHRQGQ